MEVHICYIVFNQIPYYSKYKSNYINVFFFPPFSCLNSSYCPLKILCSIHSCRHNPIEVQAPLGLPAPAAVFFPPYFCCNERKHRVPRNKKKNTTLHPIATNALELIVHAKGKCKRYNGAKLSSSPAFQC